MLAVTWHLGVHTLQDGTSVVLLLVALGLLHLSVNSAWLVAGGALVGLLVGR
jgi:hypothetical protein